MNTEIDESIIKKKVYLIGFIMIAGIIISITVGAIALLIIVSIGVIFLTLGSTFLLIINTIQKNYYEIIFKTCTKTTIGKYANMNYKRNQDSKVEYYPMYEYIVDGKSYYCKGFLGNYNFNKVDKKDVVIFYNPSNPEISYLEKNNTNKLLNIFKLLGSIFFIIGTILVIIGIVTKIF